MEQMSYGGRGRTGRAAWLVLFLTLVAGLVGMHGIGATVAITELVSVSASDHGMLQHREDTGPGASSAAQEVIDEHDGDRGHPPTPAPAHGHGGPVCCDAGVLSASSFLSEHGDLVCPVAGSDPVLPAQSSTTVWAGSSGCDPPSRPALQVWRI